MPNYSFPILNIKEVVSNLSDMGFCSVSPEQLLKVNSETVANLYESFVQYFTLLEGSTTDETEQPVFCGLDALEDLESHRDSVGIINSISKIKKLMIAAGAHDFSSRDIFRPDPQRTIRFLSAVINFCRYREGKLLVINQFISECDHVLAKELQLENRKQELEHELAEIEAERLSKQPQIQALEAEIQDLRQNIRSLNKQQSNLQADLLNLKEKNNEYNDKISNANFVLLQKTQEASQHRSQIVQSPDKLQKTLEEKRSLRAELQSIVESAMESFQKWNATVEAYTKAHKKVLKSLALLQSLQEQINSCKAVEKDVKAHKAKLKDAEKEDWALEAKRVELQVKVEQLDKSIKHTEAEKESKCTEAEKELDSLNAQIIPRLQEIDISQQKLTEKIAEVEYIHKRKIAEVLANKEAQMSRLVNKQSALISQVSKYDQLLLTQLEHTTDK